ncbi:hypothetical protein H1S01_19335 [Heliobacterium chlorum]|uniref:Uncharacterized protein n=1 Tax=Heliobacterium chlorum TaxID=2698 RepID=A0ABR7T7J7_HELCL|nr:hypothetical protein [Heliobacterium chlorum]MBC9786601.1 hypothetical protein [Heliobacterium chlorum]
MAGYLCKCGKKLSNTNSPNDIELRVYTDREWDLILQNDVIEPLQIPFPKYDVWKCPKCERIYFFDWDSGKPTKIYALEEG